MDQEKFMGLLTELLEVAAVQDGRMTQAEVDEWFEELALNREQLALVYRYLEENEVRLDRTGPAGTDRRKSGARKTGSGQRAKAEEKKTKLPEEENRYYRMYLSDLAAVPPCTPEEMALLMPRVLAGELAAADRLAEGNLHRVAEWARQYAGRGVVISDLIQEGNMILMEEIHLLKSQYPSLDVEDFLYIIQKKSETAMEEAIRQQEGYHRVGSKVAQRANRLMDLTEEMAREHGTQATAAQLARQLHITEEEVREIMKISMDVINLAKAAGNPAAFEPEETKQ